MGTTALEERLAELKRQRNAVILVHNYQRGEVQDVADFVGDSLGLSQQAAKTDADVILFCGVHFMAETAKIICPDKTVLIPDPHAGCPMANMITARELAEAKAKHPGVVVVTYVNSTAAIKAMSDLCCTSANAVKVVDSIPEGRPVLFVPDQSLGDYVAKQLGRELILWPGYCPTHHRILAEHVERMKAEHPEALFICHPECTAEQFHNRTPQLEDRDAQGVEGLRSMDPFGQAKHRRIEQGCRGAGVQQKLGWLTAVHLNVH